MVRLQQHLPEQAEEQRGRALHGEVSDDVILIGHGLPLPVLLLHVLLQIEARLLGDVVLLKEGLQRRKEGRKVGGDERKNGRKADRKEGGSDGGKEGVKKGEKER